MLGSLIKNEMPKRVGLTTPSLITPLRGHPYISMLFFFLEQHQTNIFSANSDFKF